MEALKIVLVILLSFGQGFLWGVYVRPGWLAFLGAGLTGWWLPHLFF